MEGVKKWLTERNAKKNGMYIHYSPPKREYVLVLFFSLQRIIFKFKCLGRSYLIIFYLI